MYFWILVTFNNSKYKLNALSCVIYLSGALPNKSDLLIDPEMDQELERLWERRTCFREYITVTCWLTINRLLLKDGELANNLFIFNTFFFKANVLAFEAIFLWFFQYSSSRHQPDVQQQQQQRCGTEGNSQEGLTTQVPAPTQEDRNGEWRFYRGDWLLWELTCTDLLVSIFMIFLDYC